MSENWLIFAAVMAWLAVQLARAVSAHLAASRRDYLKAQAESQGGTSANTHPAN